MGGGAGGGEGFLGWPFFFEPFCFSFPPPDGCGSEAGAGASPVNLSTTLRIDPWLAVTYGSVGPASWGGEWISLTWAWRAANSSVAMVTRVSVPWISEDVYFV